MINDELPEIILFQRRRVGDLFQSLPLVKNILPRFNDKCRLFIVVNKDLKILQPFFEPNIALIDLNDFFKEFYGIDLNESTYLDFLNLTKDAVVFDTAINLNYNLTNSLIFNIIQAGSKSGFIANQKGDKKQKIIYPLKAVSYFFNSIRHRNQNRINIADIFCLFNPDFYLRNKNHSSKDNNKGFDRLKKIKKRDHNFKRVIFAVGASSPKRQWDNNELSELIKLIHSNYPDFEIILAGLKEESDYAKQIENSLDFPILNLVGGTSLTEVIELLKTGDIIISPDTGLLQIASFIGLKIAAIFLGNANVYETGPYLEGSYVISPAIGCYPCLEHLRCEFDYECKKRIKAKDVFNLVELMLLRDGGSGFNYNSKKKGNILRDCEGDFREGRFNLYKISNDITLSPVPVFKSKLDKISLASEIFKFGWFKILSDNKISADYDDILKYLTDYFILDLDIAKSINDDIMFFKNIMANALKTNEISENFILFLKNMAINYPHLSLPLNYFISEIRFGMQIGDKKYIKSSFEGIDLFLENAHIVLNKMGSLDYRFALGFQPREVSKKLSR